MCETLPSIHGADVVRQGTKKLKVGAVHRDHSGLKIKSSGSSDGEMMCLLGSPRIPAPSLLPLEAGLLSGLRGNPATCRSILGTLTSNFDYLHGIDAGIYPMGLSNGQSRIYQMSFISRTLDYSTLN